MKSASVTFDSSLGRMELKFVSQNDFRYFISLLDDKESASKEVVFRALFHQLLTPQIGLKRFEGLSEEELEQLGRSYLKYESSLFEYFNDTGNFFNDFKGALEEERRILEESFKENVEAVFRDRFADIQTIVDHKIYLQDVLKSLQPQFDAMQKMVEDAQRFDRWFKEQAVNDDKAAVILRRYKWFITPNTPMPLIMRVIKLDGKKGRQDGAVNDLFIRFFSENHWAHLERMVHGWKNNLVLKRRYKIILDCFLTLKYLKGKKVNGANVILPTLITQIDGALTDLLISKGIAWETEYDDFIRGNNRKVGRKTQLKKNIPNTLTSSLDEVMKYVFFDVLFQGSQRGKQLAHPFNFNRHKIIHGEIVDYGRKDYIIRAFLLIDFLACL